MTDILLLASLFLVASVITVPLAARFKLGSVLGYIIAGVILSPFLSILKVDVTTLQHFAEFGVVMMLFLVGLELEPKVLWQMRHKLIGLGGGQVGLTTLLLMLGCLALGYQWQLSLAIGLTLSLSSTAIVLQTLNEKQLMKSEGGNSCFSVLLFQDIAVIPMLALIPLLALPSQESATEAAHTGGHGHESMSLVAGLEAWQQALVTIGAVVAVIVGGVLLARPIFRFVASAKLREILVATALLLVFGIALLMSLVELSPALGTFLAGVVLANSEYRHELESNIEPFKGLLLGLFFITVGASIDFGLLGDNFWQVCLLTFGVMGTKAAVLCGLSYAFKIRGGDRWLFSLGLAQAGEFGFVLLAFNVANDVIPQNIADILLLVVAISMLLTPAAFILYEFVAKKLSGKEDEREADEVEEKSPIIIAGHGRFGGVVNRMLRGLGYQTTVLDYSYSQLEVLRKYGLKVYFGDATRPELLHAAGIEEAEILIIAINEKDAITEMAHYVCKNYPKVHVIARAFDRHHVYELYAAGCRDIIRETFDSSVRVGRSSLEAMGIHPFEAERKARKFVQTDKQILISMAPLYKPDIPPDQNPEYVAKAIEIREEMEAMLQGNDRMFDIGDRAWHPPRKTEKSGSTSEESSAKN
ncbi:MAG: monovalent cation:proton antiporter-2 (CPA2) family protein [Oligoflexales bacterium]